MQDSRDLGQEGCRTGGMRNRKDTGQEGTRTVEMHDRRDAGQKGWMIGWRQDRRNTGKTGGIPDRGDAQERNQAGPEGRRSTVCILTSLTLSFHSFGDLAYMLCPAFYCLENLFLLSCCSRVLFFSLPFFLLSLKT